MTTPLSVDFRGDRDYLHGTDLFSAIRLAFVDYLGSAEFLSIRFKIPRFYIRPVSLEIVKGKNAEAIWRCSDPKGETWSGLLREDPSLPKPGRRDFDEDAMTRKMGRTDRLASFASPSQWSAIEDAVFLGKFLNNELHPLNANKQWVFTQLELDRDWRAGDQVSVQFESILDNFYSRSAVLVQGRRQGSIYFAKIDRASREMKGLK